jgi:branched-chain amino acid transport system permease protein
MEYFLELFLGGLTRGSIYALIALGYTMVYGIIELINFAHGEIYMIGAFTALIIASVLGLYGFSEISIIILASIIAIIYSSAYGFTVEKIAYKPLRHAPVSHRLSAQSGCQYFYKTMFASHKHQTSFHFPVLYRNLVSWNHMRIFLPLQNLSYYVLPQSS